MTSTLLYLTKPLVSIVIVKSDKTPISDILAYHSTNRGEANWVFFFNRLSKPLCNSRLTFKSFALLYLTVLNRATVNPEIVWFLFMAHKAMNLRYILSFVNIGKTGERKKRICGSFSVDRPKIISWLLLSCFRENVYPNLIALI